MTAMIGGSGLTFWLLLLVGLVLVSTLMQRPLKKQAAQQAAMREQVAEGSRVMLTSGLFGTVTHVGNEQLVVELAPGAEVTVLKQAVAKIVAADEEEFEFSDDAAPAQQAASAHDVERLPGQGSDEDRGDAQAMQDAAPGTEQGLGYPATPGPAN